MQCVYFNSQLPNGFEEKFVFSAQMPYTINIKEFPEEDIVPLHYADTLEILLCDGLCGEIVIDNQRFDLGGQQMFVVPPYTVHSNAIQPGSGSMYVIKVCFREMERYLNVPNLLALQGCSLGELRYVCPEFEKVMDIVDGLIYHDGALLECMPYILNLFLILSRHREPERTSPANARFKGSSLQEVIRWTHENYGRKVTIDEAAAMAGYSKYHFCARFKEMTGMTYMNYLNSVRISYACLFLRNGEAVQDVSRSCGFENVSHFIQLFKRARHMTPYQYATQQKRFPQ